MNENHLKPSHCATKYWIYADYAKYIFRKPLAEREIGKWLIFEEKEKIDQLWANIKVATEAGLLGPYSKVSTLKKKDEQFDPNQFVICIYTEDYNYTEDVERVRLALRELGIQHQLLYKLNRDAGKYEHDGHPNLIKITSIIQE